MRDTRVTVASLRSVLVDVGRNLALVREACSTAAQEGARLLFLRSGVTDFVDEVVTVQLRAERRALNHGPTRNRRLVTMVRQFERALEDEV